jgi:Ca-activated chloride channel family protein
LSNFNFIYPWFLWLLLPLIIYLFTRGKRQSLQQNMRWIVLFLLIISISRPAIKGSIKDEKIPAHSIVIALDISASMRANDIKPNREEASKDTIRYFLQKNKRDQISLIGFTTNPLLLSPFSTDHRLISTALDTLRGEYILTKGTNLKKLLQKVSKFTDSKKLLILFSDGGDETIDNQLISIIEDYNINILAIAMATTKGSSIKNQDQELLKDRKGHIVISKFNQELSKIAKVVEFSNPKDTTDTIQEWIEKQDIPKKGLNYKRYNYLELYYIPTALALLLFFISATRFISIFKIYDYNR